MTLLSFKQLIIKLKIGALMNKLLIILIASTLLSGCATKTVNVDKSTDNGKAVLSLDYRDFDTAIIEIVQSLIDSGKLTQADGKKYVMTTGEIVNDTTQRIDTRQLMASVEEQLMTSGQVEMTSSIGESPDTMLIDSRTLRDSDEFNQTTTQKKGQLIAPELSFSGKIFERVVNYDKKTKQMEYYIQLVVTDLKTGIRFWQKQVQILKRGSIKAPVW